MFAAVTVRLHVIYHPAQTHPSASAIRLRVAVRATIHSPAIIPQRGTAGHHAEDSHDLLSRVRVRRGALGNGWMAGKALGGEERESEWVCWRINGVEWELTWCRWKCARSEAEAGKERSERMWTC